MLPPVPFHGRHQAGILPQSQRQTAVISFNATADGRAELADLFRTITARARFLTAGGTPPPAGIGAPPSDSGVLGPTVAPEGLTVTVGVGSTLFDDRYGLASQRPARLKPMTAFPDDALDPAQCGGDLVLQLSAGNADAVVYALRDIARHTRGGMQALWRIDGFTSPARPSGTIPRNMLGFMDGIANPDTGNRAQMDRVDITEQENMIGRRRASGYPLDANSMRAERRPGTTPPSRPPSCSAPASPSVPRCPARARRRIPRAR